MVRLLFSDKMVENDGKFMPEKADVDTIAIHFHGGGWTNADSNSY
jgi:hypothetical protein